jgi:hypothetical protein
LPLLLLLLGWGMLLLRPWRRLVLLTLLLLLPLLLRRQLDRPCLLALLPLEEGCDLPAAATGQPMHLVWLHLTQEVGQRLQRGTAAAATAGHLPAGGGSCLATLSHGW